MIIKDTVLILGAGSSMPYGFPSGRSLLLGISSGIEDSLSYMKSGGDLDKTTIVYRAIVNYGFSGKFIEKFSESLNKTMQPSIDIFLENYPEFLEIGKVAIAAELIPCEVEKHLTTRETANDIRWYEYFFQLLGSKDDIQESNISILTFNYDRSLEYFLYNAFMNSFHMNETQAVDLMKNIPITHIYGELGTPVFLSSSGRNYNEKVDLPSIKKCVEGIKIMPEVDDSHSIFSQVHEVLSQAGKLIVIGFSFHEVNVRRLKLGETYKGRLVGTAYGMKAGEIDRVKKTLYKYSIHDTVLQNLDALNFLRETDYI